MNAPTDSRTSPAPARTVPPLPVRLVLRPPSFPQGPVCGAWWPRTDDLAAELPPLTKVFDAKGGRVTRVVAGRGSWPTTPASLVVSGRTVRAVWFSSGFDPHTIRLFAYGRGRWDLLVVPPRTEAAAAARLMAAAADPALRLTASALFAAEQQRHTEDDATDEVGRVEQWEEEGGAPRPPASAPPRSV